MVDITKSIQRFINGGITPLGDTAFVIGTGPSLKDIDISLLKNFPTITFNRAYIAFEEWGFDPTYYLAVDSNDIRSIYKDINNLILNSKIERFFFSNVTDNEAHSNSSFQDGDWVASREMFVNSSKVTILPDSAVLLNAGWIGVEILAEIGYKNIAFVGCDCRYRDDTVSNKDITINGGEYASSADTDINHFRSDYFGKGIHFGKPCEGLILALWEGGSKRMKARGVNIISCTKGSKANAWFKYVPLEQFVVGDWNNSSVPDDVVRYRALLDQQKNL